MYSRFLHVFSFALLLVLVISDRLDAQSAEEIMQHYLDTTSNGDIRNWDKIKTVFIEAVTFYSQEEFDQAATNFLPSPSNYELTYRVWPDKLKIELYQDSTYTTFLSSTLWLPNENKLVLAFNNMDPIVKPYSTELWDFFPVYLAKLVKKSKSLKYKGIKDFKSDGISCFDIELKTKDLTIDLYFNVNSYLLEYTKIYNDDSDNYVRYTDYRKIDGLLFSFSTYASKDGRIFNGQTIKRIHLNYAIDLTKFKFPN